MHNQIMGHVFWSSFIYLCLVLFFTIAGCDSDVLDFYCSVVFARFGETYRLYDASSKNISDIVMMNCFKPVSWSQPYLGLVSFISWPDPFGFQICYYHIPSLLIVVTLNEFFHRLPSFSFFRLFFSLSKFSIIFLKCLVQFELIVSRRHCFVSCFWSFLVRGAFV